MLIFIYYLYLQATPRITTLIVWSILLCWILLTPCMSKEKPVLPTTIYDPDSEESLYSKTMERDTLLNMEPVIFEPLKSIKLSRATYKVTSYINFDPYLQSFGNYRTYLNEFQDLDLSKSP